MFFEVLNGITGRGEIALAESFDGFHWNYRQIVLSEPFHLSYPYVFKWENEFYMIPESSENKAIRLYRAASFPHKWEFINNLLTGADFIDSSILRHDNTWWLFTYSAANGGILNLFYADELKGPWIRHPASPIINEDAHIIRCGGRILIWEDKIIRYVQDSYPVGGKLYLHEIVKLTKTDYEEEKGSLRVVLRPSDRGWNRDRIHNIDAHFIAKGQWIACVDGNRRYIKFRGFKKNPEASAKMDIRRTNIFTAGE
jgi:hypothetical protein